MILSRFALTVGCSLLFGYNSMAALVWSDEFNGTDIDRSIWTYDVGGHGFGNGQFEHNTARRENSYVTNGSLVIEARRENYSGNAFTSARMLTQGRFAFKYGTLEARIKLPNTANGLWPAFWMMGNNIGGVSWPGCGEIDILEMGSKEGIAQGLQQERINCAVHYSNPQNTHSYYAGWTNSPVDLSLDYHVYRMVWTPASLSFYLDDNLYGSFDITAAHLTEFHQPHFPILNIAVGGYDPSYTGVYSPAAVTATFPARMAVDYLRLYSNEHTVVYAGDGQAEAGNFGVYTETTAVSNKLAYVTGSEPGFDQKTNAALLIWNNMTPAGSSAASEGSECWAFNVASGQWFGMGVLVPNFRNMKNYSDGYLHFDIKTAGTASMKVGIKSSRGGESWLPLGTEATSEFGFAREGKWHSLKVPLNRFANIDFRTVHQMFMFAGDPPAAAMNVSIDNVWWEPGTAAPAPAGGTFGVYTESALHKTAGAFALGTQGNFFIWERTLNPVTQHPFEGTECLSLTSAPGLNWFGAAFTPNVKFNLSAFANPNGKLHVAMKTTSSTVFALGMKSGNMEGIGQKWIYFRPGADPYGFVRDGSWHAMEIPVTHLSQEVDFKEVSQLFQVLGVDGPITNLELDDIYFSGGAALTTNLVPHQVSDAVSIRWPTKAGTNYAVQSSATAGIGIGWTNVGGIIPGNGSTGTLVEPIGAGTKFYRVQQQP